MQEEEYDKIRYFLFTNSYIASKIISYLRNKYQIPEGITHQEWLERLVNKHADLIVQVMHKKGIKIESLKNLDWNFIWLMSDATERLLMPEIPKIASELNIDEKLFKIYVIYNNVPDKLVGPNKIFYLFKGDTLEEGTYIKIDESTTIRELQKLLKQAKSFSKIIQDSVGRDKQKLPRYKRKTKKFIAKSDKAKTEAYVLIEKHIKLLAEEKKANKYLDEDLYHNQLVSPAIASATDDFLDTRKNVTDEWRESKVERYSKIFSNWYYDIVQRYKLPTYRDWPAILRLMQS